MADKDPRRKGAISRQAEIKKQLAETELALANARLREINASLIDEEISNTVVQVSDKAHPDISPMERAEIKNFARSPQAQVDALRDRHPDLQIGIQNGEIIIRGDDKADAFFFDPTGFGEGTLAEQAKEAGRDALDLAPDVGKILPEVMVTAAFPIRAGAAKVGGRLIQMLRGAARAGPRAAATGATAATVEAANQLEAQGRGIEPQVDPATIATTGLLAGGSEAGLAGLLAGTGKASNVGTTKLMSLLTGVNENAISLAQRPAFARALRQFRADPRNFARFLEDVRGKLVGNMHMIGNAHGRAIENSIRAMSADGKLVSIKKAKQAFAKRGAKLEELAKRSDAPEGAVQALEDFTQLRKELFSVTTNRAADIVADKEITIITQEIPDFVSPEIAEFTRQKLRTFAGFPTVGNPGPQLASKRSARAALKNPELSSQAYGAITDSMKNQSPGFAQGVDNYHRVSEIKRTLGTKLNTSKKTQNFAKDLASPKNAVDAAALKDTFSEMDEMATELFHAGQAGDEFATEAAEMMLQKRNEIARDIGLIDLQNAIGRPTQTPGIFDFTEASTRQGILGGAAGMAGVGAGIQAAQALGGEGIGMTVGGALGALTAAGAATKISSKQAAGAAASGAEKFQRFLANPRTRAVAQGAIRLAEEGQRTNPTGGLQEDIAQVLNLRNTSPFSRKRTEEEEILDATR